MTHQKTEPLCNLQYMEAGRYMRTPVHWVAMPKVLSTSGIINQLEKLEAAKAA